MYRISLFMPIFLGLFCLSTISRASQVFIPDPYFREYLKTHYSSCMVGTNSDYLETTCSDVLTQTGINISEFDIDTDVQDLTGLQYFTNLEGLTLSNLPKLTTIPAFSPKLISLSISGNAILSSIPALPTDQLIELYITNNSLLTSIPALPSKLLWLHVQNNSLGSLPELPSLLRSLEVYYNQLTELPNLPNTLQLIGASNNLLTNLPSLPESLTSLYVSDNQLTSLPALPSSLNILDCSYNKIKNLPSLSSISSLDCKHNLLTTLPEIPASLTWIDCSYNKISFFQTLPETLCGMYYEQNLVSCLPNIPNGCGYFTTDIDKVVCVVGTPTITKQSLCTGETITIPFTVTTPLNSGNVFTAQLFNSDEPENAISIGTFTGVSSGSIEATIPVIPAGGSYRIRIVSSDPSNIGPAAENEVNVKTSPTISLQSSSNAVCKGSSATLTASGAVTYSWQASTDLVVDPSTSSKATVTPITEKTYTTTGTAANGCSNTTTITISTIQLPDVTILPSNAITVCKGTPVSLNASGADSYVWAVDEVNKNGSSIIVHPTSNSNYTVTGISMEGCSTMVSKTISTYNLPTPTITGDCNNLSSNAINVTFQWNKESSPISEATSNSFQPTECGQYTLTVTDTHGCMESSNSVQVMTINSTTTTIANPNLSNDQSLIGYPNPFNGTLKIKAMAKLVVVDMSGKIVFEKQLSNLEEEYEVDLSNQASGVYIAQLIMGDTVVSSKTIIQK